MAATLQKTKLFLPPAPARSVDRPRLRERLEALRQPACRAALVSAPAGSGKTTLVLHWLERLGWPVGWLSLDGRDDQPARFFAYLIAALQAVAPGAGEQALPLLELPGLDPEELLTLLVNALAVVPVPFVLVFDDFHLITNPILHRAVDFLLDAAPPAMRLVVLTRQDPPLSLPRRRARGQLLELRQEDLRFTLPEALDFLNQVMGLQLTPAQAEALEARTEGWIAGLQMAALSLQRAADVDRFIRDFSGSHRFILDYLVEEVLAGQPPAVQDFLLETSIVERLCGGLCAALTGKQPAAAQQQLEGLGRANLFVVPLDEERRWYRYHHLFADLLQSRLGSQDPGRVAALCLRASAWYEQEGEPRLAFEYALKAGQPELAAGLIERNAAESWQTVDLEFFFLVNRLPPAVIAARPSLCLHSAWTHVILGQVERLPPLLDAAERCLADPTRPPAPSDAADRAFARALRAYLADDLNLPVQLDGSLEQAYAAIPEAATGMRNSVAVVIGTIYFMEADFAAALRYFEDALQRDQRLQGTNAVPIATMRIAWVLQAQGRLRRAAELLSNQIEYLRQRGARRFYISGVVNLLLGEVLLEWHRLEEAGEQLRQGLRLLEDWPSPQTLALGLTLLSRLETARGRLPEARAALAQVEALQRQHRLPPAFMQVFDRARVRLWIAAGDWAALQDWVSTHAALASQELHFRYEAGQIELCRAWLALGHKDEAAALLPRLAAMAVGRDGRRLAILVLLAAALEDQPAAALAALDEALRLAYPEGYLRTFLDAGPAMRRLLQAWLERNLSQDPAALRDYARRLLAACDAPPSPPPPSSSELPEPLSARELEVLQLVAEGLTNQQIASRLFISVRTVKKHVENLHGKLGVQHRTQAVARARQLGLLER